VSRRLKFACSAPSAIRLARIAYKLANRCPASIGATPLWTRFRPETENSQPTSHCREFTEMWPFARHVDKGKRGEPMPAQNDGPPDSETPSGLCPRCGKQSSFEIMGSLPLTFDGGALINHDGSRTATHNERASVFICRHCNQGVAVLEEQWVGEYRSIERCGGGVVSWRGFHWWPLPNHQSHEAIPDHIKEAYNEAVASLAANCPRASAVMARRTLEAIATDKGQGAGTLAQRLEKMSAAGMLQPVLSDWAKEVRLIGNISAHFDPMNAVSIEDARQLTNFILQLLSYTYVMPAELNKVRGSR
jgi:hypothetical protein